MTEDAVLFRREDAIGVITLNRPDNRNSMTLELLEAFTAAVAEVRDDPALRCVVITGNGNCFSAGADFRATIQREHKDRLTLPHELSFRMYEPFMSVLDIEVPVIAALNGHTVGGGIGLALMCDVRIGARSAQYGVPFARLGLHAGLGITYLLPRLVGVSRAAELLFTGRKFLGEEAYAMGLLSAVVDTEQVMPRALAMARTIANNAPIAVRMMKRSMYRHLDWDKVRDAAYQESFAQAISIGTEDLREGVDALLSKREPNFQGK